MKCWGFAAAGLGAYVLALAAMAPATLLDSRLNEESGGRLRLIEARGTLWSGAGQFEVRDTAQHIVTAGFTHWHLVPQSLFGGRLRFLVDLGNRSFPFTISLKGLEVENAEWQVPAAALAMAVPRLVPLEPGGEIRLTVSTLSVEGGKVSGRVLLRWRDATSTLTGITRLGEYELQVESDGNLFQASLQTLNGPVELVGRGSWPQDSAPKLAATARIPASLRPQLAPALRLISIERPDGSFDIELK